MYALFSHFQIGFVYFTTYSSGVFVLDSLIEPAMKC